MGHDQVWTYAPAMTVRRSAQMRYTVGIGALAAFALLGSACMGYPAAGAMATPPPSDQSAPSRLPQLLAQLQQGSASLELFDATPASQVLGIQDSEGKTNATVSPSVSAASNPTTTGTVSGTRTPTPPATGTPRPSTTQPSEPSPTVATATATPGAATATPSPAASATPAATPSPAPTATYTPTAVRPPTEGTPTPVRPPSES
jgi:hypothetical protein